MSERVRITDVSPRDGLQNEPGVVPVAAKANLIRCVAASGVDEVEITSFVKPGAIPQLADGAEVVTSIGGAIGTAIGAGDAGLPVFSALVPNSRGMDALLAVNGLAGRPVIGKVAVFTAASETFAQRNINSSIAESIERFRPVVAAAGEHGLAVRGYISCAVACPYEGAIEPGRVADVAGELLSIGVDELDVADTIGEGTADSVAAMLLAVVDRLDGRHTNGRGEPMLTLHLHDTYGRAADCVREALRLGVRSFDGSAAGLGGCPFASVPGRPAPGNIATGTLVEAVEAEGFATGVDRARLAVATATAERVVASARLEAGVGDSSHAAGERGGTA